MSRLYREMVWSIVAVSVLLASCGSEEVPVRPPEPEIHDVWRVPADFPTIQEALDHAADADTVLLAPGVYRGEGNRDLTITGKSLVLIGSAGAESCIVDCGGPQEGPHQGLRVVDAPARETLICGLTVRNADGVPGVLCWNAFSRILNCRIESNSADGAAGLYLVTSNTYVADCSFRGNTAYEGNGSAILVDGGTAVFERCLIEGNETEASGAIYCEEAVVRLIQVDVIGNWANSYGGGVAGKLSSISCSRCRILNNSAETGGGIAAWLGTVVVVNCTVASNVAYLGGGIFSKEGSAVNVRRSIIWGNCGGNGADVVGYGDGVVFLEDSSVDSAGVYGNGQTQQDGTMIYQDPGFCRYDGCGEAVDVRLVESSPCRLPGDVVYGATSDACP
jgi:hypothetical protein